MALEAGSQPIPGHRLTFRLGAGSFAEVWEAVREDGRKVALKFLDTRARGSSQVASEVRILRGLAELQHPHIIQLHAVVAASRYVVLVMERATCNLEDLRQAYLAETTKNIPPAHALDLLDQAAGALDFLAGLKLPGFSASHGLQHCDVKPANLLLVGPQLKVADFGLCAGAGWQTHHKGWKGTVPYAAPELFTGSAGPGTDQYALAITFCAMVMGDRPFKNVGATAPPTTGLPIDLMELRDQEATVIARALHPYPSLRWPSCRAFMQALRKAVEIPREKVSLKIHPRGRVGTLRDVGA